MPRFSISCLKNMHIFFFALLFLFSSCATSYSLADGSKRIIGFVNMTIPAANAASSGTCDKTAGNAFRIKSIGLLLYHHANQSGVSIGYSNYFLMALKNDSFVGETQFTEARK